MDNQSPVGVCENILKEHPEINIQKLAESSGFLSQSNFIKLFPRKKDVRLPNGKNQIGNNLCSKKHRKRSQKPISKKCSNDKKVLIRQFKKC